MLCPIAILVSWEYFSPAIGGGPGPAFDLAQANLAQLFTLRVDATKRNMPGNI